MAVTKADLQRFLPSVAIASLVMITVTVLLIVSLDTVRPPKAVMVLSRERVHPGEAVVLDARNSSDPDGGDLEYRWSIDDRVFSDLDRWTYLFPALGNHTVELTVTDEEGASDRVAVVVEVVPWPEGSADMPG